MKQRRHGLAHCALTGLLIVELSFTGHAGDILRGGAPMLSPQASSSKATSAMQAMMAARQNNVLTRTNQGIQAVQAMQATARQLAQGANNLGKDPNHPGQQLPNVPDGLTAGGLLPDSGMPAAGTTPGSYVVPGSWQGVGGLSQNQSGGKTNVTIKQSQQQALLTWQSFNVGAKTALKFDQSAGGKNVSQWIAFNKINDPSGVPSQILGSISAPGQVYLLNQNGIIFGGASQINLHTLVASSLPINDNLISRGLLNNPDEQFLFSSLALPAGSNGTPAFTPPAAPNGKSGDITVQPGASISAPTTPDHVGGRVALIGANVTNAGSISTPDGQTILAAGQQVGFTAHSSNDPSLRGLDTYIGAVDSTSGVAKNTGLINAPRANVTIAGKEVDQLGAVASTTSVSLNGSVDLVANYNSVSNGGVSGLAPFSPSATGIVTLGRSSVTDILPEWDSVETITGVQLALPSHVSLQGKAIHLDKDATLLAPNGSVNAAAGNWFSSSGNASFVYTDGQIYLDSGATINVAGSADVSAPISENILSVQLRGAEFADSPLQRNGPFRGQTINIDVRQQGIYNGLAWIGTPLANTIGYVGLIERSVGELTTAGGSVKLNAGNSVVMQPGSFVDVSGGWINYQGGTVETSRVVSNGQILDISQATPDRVYDGIYDGSFITSHVKWGLTDTYTNPLLTNAHWEDGYTYGANAGSVSITAPSMALDGKLLGNTVSGPRQRTLGPKSGELSLTFQAQNPATTDFFVYSPMPPKIVFDYSSNLKPADPFALDASGNPLPLRSDRRAEIVLSPDLVSQDGFNILAIDNKDGTITVPANANVSGAAINYSDENGTVKHGSITLGAANIEINGDITVPGGALSLSAYSLSPYSDYFHAQNPTTPPYDSSRGNFTLAATASLSTAGLIVDDRPGSEQEDLLPLVTDGGTISIKSSNAKLTAGSLLDVSGGVAVSSKGKASYGAGGNIVIQTGQDLEVGAILGGKLTLGSALKGYSGGTGGSLSIQAPLIQIGGAASNPNILFLEPDFFSQGGFSKFTLSGLGAALGALDQFSPAISIAPGTSINPIVKSWIAIPDAKDGNAIHLMPVEMPEGLRTPFSITLNAPGVLDSGALLLRGDIVIGAGSVINTGPKGSVSLNGNTVSVLGDIFAPAGSISIAGGNNSSALFSSQFGIATATVDLGKNSILSTAGTLILTPDGRGYRTGQVLPGGSITVSGNIVAEAGAILDVSGATGVLDLSPAYSDTIDDGSLAGSLLVPTRVDSNGGVITLKGTQELFTDATLLGFAGGPAALGGSLVVSSGFLNTTGNVTNPSDISLIVTQNGPAIPLPFSGSPIGKKVVDENGNTLPFLGHIAANNITSGGFSFVTLGDTRGAVQFLGPISISVGQTLSVAPDGFLFADSAVSLNAHQIILGTAFQAPYSPLTPPTSIFTDGQGQPFYALPTYGTGRLTVTADLIDVGNLSLQNIGKLNLIAKNGDIRGDGTLDIAGDISLTAGQIYPATATSFTIAAYDHAGTQGSITINAFGNRQLPLSAGGQFNIYASTINQGGVLRAPMGQIHLGWDGDGTAPSQDLITGAGIKDGNGTLIANLPVTQQLTLSPGSITSISAIDPVTGEALVIPFGINLNGSSWIDPAGTDITTTGLPEKTINISAQKIVEQDGAVIDIRGGGDLYAYRFNSGLGGSIDILSSYLLNSSGNEILNGSGKHIPTSSFAILPSYQADYTPYAPFNTISGNFTNTAGVADPGYVADASTLHVGDRIYLNASNGLAAGSYTLLPARYALLPGAFLITPRTGVPTATVLQPDGSNLVGGYRFNTTQTGRPLFSSFEIASQAVVNQRAEYDISLANTFFSKNTKLPNDSGRLVLRATQAMSIEGALLSKAADNARGALVDISSPVDILIAGPKTNTAGFNGLVLDSSELSSFGAASLLVGGMRDVQGGEATVTVTTNNLKVDNSGSPLAGEDIVLVANKTLTLSDGASVTSSGASSQAETMTLNGNGTLLRISSDSSAQTIRKGVTSSNIPAMTIGAGVHVAAGCITLDSSYATTLDSSVSLQGDVLNLNSGQISIELNNPGALQPTAGLVLSGAALQTLQSSAKAFSLLSYSSIDLYGDGQVGSLDASGTPVFQNLALHAAEIRGFGNGGNFTFNAQNITLDNSPGSIVPGPVIAPNGTLKFDANVLNIGVNQLKLDQFSSVTLNAAGGILAQSTGGLFAQNDMVLSAPLITGAASANQNITAGGALTIQQATANSTATITGGLGATLAFIAASISDNGNISLPSGALKLEAKTGDLLIGNAANSQLDVSGVARNFFDLVKYSNGGDISLVADGGSVSVAAGSTINVSAPADGGNAGSLSISAPTGAFSIAGLMKGAAGSGGQGGVFALDISHLPTTDLSSLTDKLTAGGFSKSIIIRDRNDASVTVDGVAAAHSFTLSLDNGSLSVIGTINASGPTGGTINLDAFGNIVLASSSVLNAVGQSFDDAGKGGAISIETTHGRITIADGSAIDLSVASNNDPASNDDLGKFNGTLHLRAPQISAPDYVAIDPIAGSILNASSIIVEGFFAQDAASTSAASITNFQNAALANATSFMNNAAAIQTRLLATQPAAIADAFQVVPGEEIDNSKGDLVLSKDWDLSTARYGSKNSPGALTLRAAGDLVFNGALSDGFKPANASAPLYSASLMARNVLLPANAQAWSYRLTAGADLSAADFRQVQAMAGDAGSLKLGVNGVGSPSSGNNGTKALTSDAVKGHYQVIRTGAGDIDIATRGSVQLLNQFATIYTAGTQVADPTMGGTFVLPPSATIASSLEGNLGATQETPTYPAQYSLGGGNVTINAQADIKHLTLFQGQLVDDSEKQLPDNWLYRRGYVGADGKFGNARFGDVASTTWWIDFSNFFEGVGALGGGNVTLAAGGDVRNVDAVASTNARMPGGIPDASKLLELGGGDVTVRAGRNIDGGVYYVERGNGLLSAGNTIKTNSTRSPSVPKMLDPNAALYPTQTWLPTTLYLGKGDFDITARGDVLLGPMVNPFLMPQGISNTFYSKTYFSTYSTNDTVNVSSLGGQVTLRESVTLPGNISTEPILIAWLENVSLLRSLPATVSFYQPWLRLAETSVNPQFNTFAGLMPPALQIINFSGDINLVGNITLSPAPKGSIDLTAAGSINALQPNGITSFAGTTTSVTSWGSSVVNLSDTDPGAIPGVASPSAYQAIVGTSANAARLTGLLPFATFNPFFAESGSLDGEHAVSQAKQALHARGLLHLNDTNPIHLYAVSGDISGLTLFSGKATRILAGNDISDISFYLQNNTANDLSVISAGRDILAYDANSTLLQAASQSGNATNSALNHFNTSPTQAGDIQISGPGTLEVLAARNLDLGTGASNSDGTGVGITSIGNARNPYLPFQGADIIASAGMGSLATGLDGSNLDFKSFVSQFLEDPINGARYLSELGSISGISGSVTPQTFSQLSAEDQDRVALAAFYLVLRDAGRDHNDPLSPTFGTYTAGLNAVTTLFSKTGVKGDITTNSRDIRTKSGGNISLFAPGGQLTLQTTAIGNPQAPPGIITEDGGDISIFTDGDVNIGISRIFTLRGGNIVIWSSSGNIAAGSSAKTVQSAPPTRVLIDPQSADVSTDLAGLATGGGIGVLATVTGVPPGNVDLIAPTGVIDAGDAGIRSVGNLNLAAVQILNASNIQVGGATAGAPTTVVAAPNISGLTAASNTAGASTSAASQTAQQQARSNTGPQEDVPSVITVEVLGYGGEG